MTSLAALEKVLERTRFARALFGLAGYRRTIGSATPLVAIDDH